MKKGKITDISKSPSKATQLISILINNETAFILYKNVKIKINGTIVFLLVLYEQNNVHFIYRKTPNCLQLASYIILPKLSIFCW
jgi:hypothetical protein